MKRHNHKTARRRYFQLFWPLMALYVAVVAGGTVYSRMVEPEALWIKAVFGVAMGLPILGVLFVMVRFFEEADEYIRLMQLRAFAYGTARHWARPRSWARYKCSTQLGMWKCSGSCRDSSLPMAYLIT